MHQKNIPVIVGAAQITQNKQVEKPLDPLNLIAQASLNAIKMSGVDGLRNSIDNIYMSTISSWIYDDAPRKLSNLLGIEPTQKYIAPISGNVPQFLVNKAAKAIYLGKSNAILIAGGEASYSKYRAEKDEITLNWPKPPPRAVNKARKAIIFYLSQFENQYKFTNPTFTYALIETAFRAASGRTLKEHLDQIGELYERFSIIASKNPYAWQKTMFNAEEIITPTSDNRKVCHPYTKHLVANLYVDQSAALVMTSEEIAQKLGIDRKFWVYPMGGADLKNIFYMTQRPQLYDSPAIREASRLALEQTGLKLEDINVFDLYSCFPCMVEIARKEIGIPEDDPRDLTITGGLSFFGGPFSSYSMHSIVTAVDLIQNNPSMKIMILANGGYNTSESVGIYGNKPPAKPWKENENNDIQQKIDAKSLPEPIEKANGNLTIEAYTIIYDRKSLPEWGVVMGHLESGERTLAFIIADTETLLKLEQQELVGQTFRVTYDPELGYNKLIF
ncbi:MAG: acetyl-CoA acetyltransferase [Promethearchaeota archaeon]